MAPIRPPEPEVRKLRDRKGNEKGAKVCIARKTMYITGCGCIIKPGHEYVSIVCLVDGKFVYERHHLCGCLELLH